MIMQRFKLVDALSIIIFISSAESFYDLSKKCHFPFGVVVRELGSVYTLQCPKSTKLHTFCTDTNQLSNLTLLFMRTICNNGTLTGVKPFRNKVIFCSEKNCTLFVERIKDFGLVQVQPGEIVKNKQGNVFYCFQKQWRTIDSRIKLPKILIRFNKMALVLKENKDNVGNWSDFIKKYSQRLEHTQSSKPTSPSIPNIIFQNNSDPWYKVKVKFNRAKLSDQISESSEVCIIAIVLSGVMTFLLLLLLITLATQRLAHRRHIQNSSLNSTVATSNKNVVSARNDLDQDLNFSNSPKFVPMSIESTTCIQATENNYVLPSSE